MKNKKYNIIYADPPWTYKNSKNQKSHPRFAGIASNHYDTMNIEHIKSLDVQSLSDKNCMLFLWVTFPCLQEGLDVIKSWGFTYKTIGFTWVKTYSNTNNKPFFGIGYYTKSNAELCLLGVKGRPFKVSNSISSIIISPKGSHSEKPNEVRNKIVDLCGDIPRIELFARSIQDGWDVWGDEVLSDIKFGINELHKIKKIKKVKKG